MKKTIKKIVEVILTIIAVIAFVLMTGESSNPSMQVMWTLGWAAVLAGCCRGLEKIGTFNK